MGMFGKIVNYTSFVGSLAAVAVGFIHVGNAFQEWCQESSTTSTECFGPWLVWKQDCSTALLTDECDNTDDINPLWRFRIFTFLPQVFADTWTPVVLGLALVASHGILTQLQFLTANWIRFAVWHLFVALFGCFGYSGQLGIIDGFLLVVVGCLCIVANFTEANGGEKPTLKLQFGKVSNYERRYSARELNIPQMSAANLGYKEDDLEPAADGDAADPQG